LKLCVLLFWLTTVAAAQSFNPLANNTSACLAAGNPSGCTSGYSAVTTNPANTGAVTVITDPVPANTNISDLHGLLYSGSTTAIYFHYMDWWGCSGHFSIGKVGNNSSVIANEAAEMLGFGAAGLIIDWAGNRDASKSCRLANTNAWAAYLTAHPGTLKMAVNIDQSGFQGTCPTGATDQASCITTELNAELDYVNTNYASQSWYLKDGGSPVVHYFIDEASWTGTNWTTVWASVKGHTNLYSAPFKFIFENSFSHTQGNGAFRWFANPPVYSASSQLFWGSSSSTTPTSYNTFYSDALAAPTKTAFGIVDKGFDDGFGFGGGFGGKNRVNSQRCGRTWLDTFNLIAADGFSSSNQLADLQIATFNDYEEGTPIEMGISNCFTLTANISALSVNWTLSPTDATYATLATVDHLRILSCTSATSCVTAIDNISPALSGSNSLRGIPSGMIYVQAVGKPAIQNVLSPLMSFAPPGPVSALFAKAY
jgi:hypothetical protein